MPELPEVEVVKKSLERNILNLIIKKVKIKDTNLRYKVDKIGLSKLVGKKITKIERRSKFLIFELEDSALIHHKNDAISFCKVLVSLGCKITVEHFGDNLASLAGLRAIQPHFVKISGKLTKDIHTDKDNQLFVSSLLSIARGLNINVIAELVENEAESVALTQLDVAYQQGFYFAKPTLWQN